MKLILQKCSSVIKAHKNINIKAHKVEKIKKKKREILHDFNLVIRVDETNSSKSIEIHIK